MAELHGVNLGGWLVLEPWMTPALFLDSGAVDEYSWCEPGLGERDAALLQHRHTFITEADIAWLAERGVNALRVPIPYWAFGDVGPYRGCTEQIDWLLAMASKYRMGVLLDLHTAPGSQNGDAHSGRKGRVDWTVADNIDQTLTVLRRIADRYAAHPNVIGLELLNEPSPAIDHDTLLDFYQTAIQLIRRGSPDTLVVVSDAYRPRDWLGSSLGEYDNVWLDVHLYQVFSDADKRLDIHKHIKKAKYEWAELITGLQQTVPVIVGEWSAALDNRTYRGMADMERDKAVQAYAAAQLEVFEQATGWFYWSYKTESGGAWSFRDSVSRGWLPPSYGQ